MSYNKKMVYTTLDKKVRERMSAKPKLIPAEVFDSADDMSEQFEHVEKYYKKNLFKLNPALRRQIKNRFIYTVIHRHVYDEKLARKYRVSLAEIYRTNNAFWHYRECLIQQSEYSKFLEYLHEQAKEAYSIETKACADFDALTPLEYETHTSPPRYWLEKELSLALKESEDLKRTLKSLRQDWVIGQPIDTEIADKRTSIQERIAELKDKCHTLKDQLEGKRPKGERKHFFYIERFKTENLYSGADFDGQYISMGSVSTVKELLREYCSWFNRVHAEEIKSHQIEERKEKQRLAYAKRNAEKLEKKKEETKQLQMEVYPLIRKGLSLRKIATKLNKSYRAVRKASKEIERLILAQ